MKFLVIIQVVVFSSLLLLSCSLDTEVELNEAEKIIEDIKSNPKWLKDVKQQANERNISIDSMLIRAANYKIRIREERKELTEYRANIISQIKSNPRWVESIKDEAQKRKISFDSMLVRSVNYRIRQDKEKNLLKKKQSKIIEEIRSTPKWIKKIQTQAKERGISVDSMLVRNANYIINKSKEN